MHCFSRRPGRQLTTFFSLLTITLTAGTAHAGAWDTLRTLFGAKPVTPSLPTADATKPSAPLLTVIAQQTTTPSSANSPAEPVNPRPGFTWPFGRQTPKVIPPRSERPFNYTGDARPPELKVDEYLSIWPTDDNDNQNKFSVLKLNRKSDPFGPRGWLDLEVNKHFGQAEISTPAVFELPVGDQAVHKVMLWRIGQFGTELVFTFRLKDEHEFRAAAQFMGERLKKYSPELVYLKRTEGISYKAHEAKISMKSVNGQTVETANPTCNIESDFDNRQKNMFDYETPPNEGGDFFVARISLYDLLNEPDPSNPKGMRSRAGVSVQKVFENVLTDVFRELAPYDLIFAYIGTIRNNLDAGNDVAPAERTAEYVSEDGTFSRVSLYQSKRTLSQAKKLSPVASQNINNQIDYYHLGAIPVAGRTRPVMIKYLPNAVIFMLRVNSPEEAAWVQRQFGEYVDVYVSDFTKANGSTHNAFERARVRPNELMVTLRFIMDQYVDHELRRNLFVTPERKSADAVAMFAKQFGLRLVAADYVTQSLAEFDESLSLRHQAALPSPVADPNHCGPNLHLPKH